VFWGKILKQIKETVWRRRRPRGKRNKAQIITMLGQRGLDGFCDFRSKEAPRPYRYRMIQRREKEELERIRINLIDP